MGKDKEEEENPVVCCFFADPLDGQKKRFHPTT